MKTEPKFLAGTEAFPPERMEVDPYEQERLWNQAPNPSAAETKEFDGAYADDDIND